ncbi:MAG: hypothetical protein AAF598_02770 [Bacteroidota bacterium]
MTSFVSTVEGPEQPINLKYDQLNRWEHFRLANVWTKLFNWEYWPTAIVNIPVIFYWLYFALRSRKLFFFSNTNPVIETGGVLGESKINILKRLPESVLPVTLFFEPRELTAEHILPQIKAAGLSYPIIVKPDVGERGFLVEKLKSEAELLAYIDQHKNPLILQECIEYPMELSVLYYRMPEATTGTILSVCIKETLTIVGDGVQTVESLLLRNSRARLQFKRLRQSHPILMNRVLAPGESFEVEPIGNHSRGTKFLNGNQYINMDLTTQFDAINLASEGMLYGRYDLKCTSIEDLSAGKGFKILEYNGVGGEPAHVYDPDYPLWKAYRDFYRCWRAIFQVSRAQSRLGIQPMTIREGIRDLKKYMAYMKQMS